jgi:hypothetical protein
VHLIRIFSITAAASLLAACSGGGGSTMASHTTSAPTSPVVTPNANGKTTATIHIHLTARPATARTAKSATRKPEYLDTSDTNGLIITDTPATGTPQSVFADVRQTPLSPLCVASMTGFDCNIVAPAIAGVTNTYTVTALDAAAEGQPYSLQNIGTNGNAPGYGSGFTQPVAGGTVTLSIGSSTPVTPTTGTNTAVSIVLDPVVANMVDDSNDLALGVPAGTPGLLNNQNVFVDDGGIVGSPDIYVVVAGTPANDTFGPLPEDADQASIVNSTGNPQVFAGPTDVAFPVAATIMPLVNSTTTGVVLSPASPLSFASPTEFGPLPVPFTYNGSGTSPAQISVTETTPMTGSPTPGGTDQFGNNYNETGSVLYVVAPFSVTPLATAALGAAGSATITASVFGVTNFTVVLGSCAGDVTPTTPTTPTSNASTGNSDSTFTITSTGTAATGTSCTFTVDANFTPTAPSSPPLATVTVPSAQITVNF